MSKGSEKSLSKSTVKRRKIEADIVNIIKTAPKPLSTTEIAEQLEVTWHTTMRHCLDLQLAERLTKFEVGRVSVWMVKNE